MEVFQEYFSKIEQAPRLARMKELFQWIAGRFPTLEPRIAWNQPMFTEHGTFIIGFSMAREHLAISPERAGILRFSKEIHKAGYVHSKQLIRVRWDQPLDYTLLENIIVFNREDKKDCTAFWRK